MNRVMMPHNMHRIIAQMMVDHDLVDGYDFIAILASPQTPLDIDKINKQFLTHEAHVIQNRHWDKRT